MNEPHLPLSFRPHMPHTQSFILCCMLIPALAIPVSAQFGVDSEQDTESHLSIFDVAGRLPKELRPHIAALGNLDSLKAKPILAREGSVSGHSGPLKLNGSFRSHHDTAKTCGFLAVELTAYQSTLAWKEHLGSSRDSLIGKRSLKQSEIARGELLTSCSPLLTLAARYGTDRIRLVHSGTDRSREDSSDKPLIQSRAKDQMLIEFDGTPYRLSLDTKSFLVVRATDGENFDIEFSRFRVVGGLRVATRIAHLQPSQNLELTYSGDSTTFASQDREFAAIWESLHPSDAEDRSKLLVEDILASLDKSGDKKVSPEEADAELLVFFRALDSDTDGLLDASELQVAADNYNRIHTNERPSSKTENPTTRVTAAQIVESLDRNGDNQISRNEASAELLPYFELFDSDQDDQIDLREAQAISDSVNSRQADNDQ